MQTRSKTNSETPSPALRGRVGVGVFLILLCLVACRDNVPLTASQQAEYYYTMLLQGDYETFIRGTYGCDSLPPDYLQQRIDLLAQHVRIEQKSRGGYLGFKAIDEHILPDSTRLVHLEVLFGDSTREQIACPMLWHADRWLMRN